MTCGDEFLCYANRVYHFVLQQSGAHVFVLRLLLFFDFAQVLCGSGEEI